MADTWTVIDLESSNPNDPNVGISQENYLSTTCITNRYNCKVPAAVLLVCTVLLALVLVGPSLQVDEGSVKLMETHRYLLQQTDVGIATRIEGLCSGTVYPDACAATLEADEDLSWPFYVEVRLKLASLAGSSNEAHRSRTCRDASPMQSDLPSKSRMRLQCYIMQMCIDKYVEYAQKNALLATFTHGFVIDTKLPPELLNNQTHPIKEAYSFHLDCLDSLEEQDQLTADSISCARGGNLFIISRGHPH